MTKQEFIKYLSEPQLLNQNSLAGLRDIIDDYPYFPAARMLYLRNLRNVNSYKFESELTKHAIFIPNRKLLYRLLTVSYVSESEFELLPFDKSAFDKFFDKNAEVDLNDLNISKTSTFTLNDELQSIAANTDDEPIDLIDRFIIENPTIKSTMTADILDEEPIYEEKGVVDDSLITETLAGVYMAQGLYDEALEAYEKLSLKFPEKNSYFATQIEKIKTLISKKL